MDFATTSRHGQSNSPPAGGEIPLRKEPSSGPMRASGPTKKRSIIAPSSAPFGGTCPYPLCRCATSSLPLLAFGHFPLTGGIGPLIRGVGPLGGGRLDGRLIAAPTADTEAVPSSVGAGPRPARNYGPAITCSAKPGAVVEPHQRKFLQTQGPVAREEFRCPLRFCAPEILLHPSGTRPP